MMKLTKTQISVLNRTAKTDWPKAQAMLEGINLVLGTQYGWAASRVVWFENPNGSTAEKYAHYHDAYAFGLDDEQPQVEEQTTPDEQPKRYVYTEKGAAAMAWRFPGIKAGDIYDRPVPKGTLKSYVRMGYIAEAE